jgi:hypothetical protein
MLLPPMTSLRLPLAILGALACAALPLSGCSSEQHSLTVKEGEPLHLGDLSYNIALSRFLNPNDNEDRSYLVDQPPASRNQQYLGVFMTVDNSGSKPLQIGQPMQVVDTRGNAYEPIPSTSEFALPLDASVEPGSLLPGPDTPPASGPIKASMVLFRIDSFVTENRPIKLEIPGPNGETGSVELDL